MEKTDSELITSISLFDYVSSTVMLNQFLENSALEGV